MTVGEWLDTWMRLYVVPSRLAPSSVACYNRAVRAVPEWLARHDVATLTALDVMPWLLDVAREHPRAAQLDRVMLSRSLRIAAKLGLCPPGIIDPETCPAPVYAAPRALILDVEQLRAYMAAAASTPVAPVLMACACGLRRGEALGLRWDAVDLTSGVLRVEGQRRGLELAPLKSQASRRQLIMPAVMVEVLRTWPRSVTGWVCDVSQQRVYREHRALLARLGFPPVTLHGLRHSLATAAVMTGVPVKVVQGTLGHGHYQITADLYANHLPSVSPVCERLFA